MLDLPSSAHAQVSDQIDLDLQLSGTTEDVTGVDFAADMPTMGRMQARVLRSWRAGEGHYQAVAQVDRGGLWRVETVIHRISGGDAVATFEVRI
ncbi:MAG TPA: hypothetical protein VF157_10285 [Chloroflexota bacterium]